MIANRTISNHSGAALRRLSDLSRQRRAAQAVIKTRGPAILRLLAAEVPVAGKALGELVAGFADSYIDDRVAAYRDARKSVEEFRSALREMAQSVSADPEHPLLVVMIDELDRCRPSYSVELLEVAKHLFSVDGVLFVIAVNRAQLAHSIHALYGTGFDARGYLGRFFDVDFRLPNPDRSRFIKATIEAVGIRAYLGRTPDQSGSSELSTLESLLEAFLGQTVVSLRTVARAIHHLGVVYAGLADKRLVLGTTTAVLVILRTLDRDMYYRFVDGRASDAEVVDGVIERLGENARASHERDIAAFEAWVIASRMERDRGSAFMSEHSVETPLMQRYGAIVAEEGAEDSSSADQKAKHAREVLKLFGVTRTPSP